MTDLQIRRIILDEISRATINEYQAKKNRDKIAVMYFSGCQDALRNVLAQIKLVVEKEIEEMEKQQNGK